MGTYNFYRIEYRGGVETVVGLTQEDAIDTFYNYMRQEHGFTHNETARELFPITHITTERR